MGGFLPSPDLAQWISTIFIEEMAPWPLTDIIVICRRRTSDAFGHPSKLVTQGHRRIGQAERPRPPANANAWVRGRWEQQIREWFGNVPDFILTFDAMWSAEASDREWCSLVDHELSHCVQALNAFGEPRFNREGLPVFSILGHLVEEFPDVVARYGVHAAAGDTVGLVTAASRPALVTDAMIALACGRRQKRPPETEGLGETTWRSGLKRGSTIGSRPFIVEQLAAYETPNAVARLVKDEFGIAVFPQGCRVLSPGSLRRAETFREVALALRQGEGAVRYRHRRDSLRQEGLPPSQAGIRPSPGPRGRGISTCCPSSSNRRRRKSEDRSKGNARFQGPSR